MTPNTTLRVINDALRRTGRTRLVPPAMVGARVFDVGVHASPNWFYCYGAMAAIARHFAVYYSRVSRVVRWIENVDSVG